MGRYLITTSPEHAEKNEEGHHQMVSWRKPFQSIRFVLTLAFTLSLLIPIGAIMLYGHHFTSRILTEQTIAHTQQEVMLQAKPFTYAMQQVQSDAVYLQALASMRELQQMADPPESEADWYASTRQDFLVFASANPMYFRLRYLDTSGNEIIRVDSDAYSVRPVMGDALENRSNTPYFQQAIQQEPEEVYLSSFYIDDETERRVPIVRYAMRLEQGVLVFDIYAAWLLRHMPEGDDIHVWAIIDAAGHHLLFPRSEGDSRDYRAMLTHADKAIQRHMPAFLSQPDGLLETPVDMYVYSRIELSMGTPDTFWILYRRIPKSVLFAAVDNFYQTSLAVLSVAVVAAVTFGVFSGRQILEPVLDLQRKASDFARGKRLPPAPDPLPLYELGTLTETFHEMAGELEQERQQKIELIKKLIHAQEEERKLVAYDLHDGLIQQLVGARMYFSMLQENLRPDDTVTERFEHGCDALTEAVVEGRRIIQGLHPTILDDLGLVDAIAELAQQMAARRTWELTLDIDTLPHEPDKSVSVTVFRIVQEALNNTGKHAEANRVRVSLRYDDDSLKISVSDDGAGFDMQAVSKRHPSHGESGFGISTMRERASLINGHWEIESAPGEGTTVHVTVPCHLPDALIID